MLYSPKEMLALSAEAYGGDAFEKSYITLLCYVCMLQAQFRTKYSVNCCHVYMGARALTGQQQSHTKSQINSRRSRAEPLFRFWYDGLGQRDPLRCCCRVLGTHQIVENGTIRLRQIFVTSDDGTADNLVGA